MERTNKYFGQRFQRRREGEILGTLCLPGDKFYDFRCNDSCKGDIAR